MSNQSQPTAKAYKEKLYTAEKNYKSAKDDCPLIVIILLIGTGLVFLANYISDIEQVTLITDKYQILDYMGGMNGGNIKTFSSRVFFHFTPKSDNITRTCTINLTSRKHVIDQTEKDKYKEGNSIDGYFSNDTCYIEKSLFNSIIVILLYLIAVAMCCFSIGIGFNFIICRNEVYVINRKLNELDPEKMLRRQKCYESGEFVIVSDASSV